MEDGRRIFAHPGNLPLMNDWRDTMKDTDKTRYDPLYYAAEQVREIALGLTTAEAADMALVDYAVELVQTVARHHDTLVTDSDRERVTAANGWALQITTTRLARHELAKLCGAPNGADPLSQLPIMRERMFPKGKLPHQTLPDFTGWTHRDLVEWRVGMIQRWADPEVAVAAGEAERDAAK